MAGINRFSVTIDGERQVDLGISRMVAAVTDMRPFWPAFQEAFFSSEQEQFASQGSQGGRGAWPSLSPKYAAWKARVVGNKPILQFTGAMMEALTSKASGTIYEDQPTWLALGAAMSRAMYHQRGQGLPVRRPIDISSRQEVQYFGRAIGYMARDLGYMWSGTGGVRG